MHLQRLGLLRLAIGKSCFWHLTGKMLSVKVMAKWGNCYLVEHSKCFFRIQDTFIQHTCKDFGCVNTSSDERFWFCQERLPASRRPQFTSLKKGWFLISAQSLFLNPRRLAGSFSIRPSQIDLQSVLKAGVYETGSFKILRVTSVASTWMKENILQMIPEQWTKCNLSHTICYQTTAFTSICI